jgi:hypothetical protein
MSNWTAQAAAAARARIGGNKQDRADDRAAAEIGKMSGVAFCGLKQTQKAQQRTSKQNPEYEIQAEFVRQMSIKYPEVMVFSDTAAHIRKNMFQQIRANRLQSKISKDWPDVLIAQPSGTFSGLFLEFKAESPFLKDGLTLSRDKHIQAQAATMQRLNERGYHCAFVWSVEMAITLVDKYLNL